MPNITGKLKAEERNERTVRLWPEGYGYKAYERSAYLFVTQVRNYQVSRRYVDAAGLDVVSIKFPKLVIDKLALSLRHEDDGSVSFRMDTALDEQQYLQWRDSISLTVEARKSSTVGTVLSVQPCTERTVPTVLPEHDVAERIRMFNLAAATPLECMLFLSELKQKLTSGDGKQ